MLSGDEPDKTDYRAASRQSLALRADYIAARRESAAERDAQRFALAAEIEGWTAIPPERGFVVVAPGQLPPADGVAAAANELIDSIGHDRLLDVSATKRTKPYLASGFLDKSRLDLDSPYLRFALSDEVVTTVTAYLGVVPVLKRIDIMYSVAQNNKPKASQLWHLDHDDIRQVKVWVHCSDIGPESGPLTVLDAAHSAELAERIDYDMGAGYRVPDGQLAEYTAAGAVCPSPGLTGRSSSSTRAAVSTSAAAWPRACRHDVSRISCT